MMPYFNCLPTISVLWLFLTVTWVDLKCVIVVLPDHTRSLFMGQFMRVWYLSHKRYQTGKDQTRLQICAVSPEALGIALKRRDVDDGSGQYYGPVQKTLVFVAYASSEGSGETAHSHSITKVFANHTKKTGCR